MLDRPKKQSAIGALWQRWRDWRQMQSEFAVCGEEGVERMAHDSGLSVNELQELATHGPQSADLLLKRMKELDLDPNEVAQVEPQVFRDLQRVCTLCGAHKRCAAALEQDPDNPAWKGYCPNVQTLTSLDALPWSARREV
jgi:hypothetical protein